MSVHQHWRSVNDGNDCRYYNRGGGRTALERRTVARGTGTVNRLRATDVAAAAATAAVSGTPATSHRQHRRHSRRHHDNGGRVQFRTVETLAKARTVGRAADPVSGRRDGQAELTGRVARRAQTVWPQEKEERSGRRRFGGSVAATVAHFGDGRHRRTGGRGPAAARRRPGTSARTTQQTQVSPINRLFLILVFRVVNARRRIFFYGGRALIA